MIELLTLTPTRGAHIGAWVGGNSVGHVLCPALENYGAIRLEGKTPSRPVTVGFS